MNDKTKAEFTQRGIQYREKMSSEERDIEGSKTNVLILCDILHRRCSDKDLARNIVGYTLKCKEDLTYTRRPFNKHPKHIMDTCEGDIVYVKSSEEFSVNMTEAISIICRAEYGGRYLTDVNQECELGVQEIVLGDGTNALIPTFKFVNTSESFVNKTYYVCIEDKEGRCLPKYKDVFGELLSPDEPLVVAAAFRAHYSHKRIDALL